MTTNGALALCKGSGVAVTPYLRKPTGLGVGLVA